MNYCSYNGATHECLFGGIPKKQETCRFYKKSHMRGECMYLQFDDHCSSIHAHKDLREKYGGYHDPKT